MNVIDIINQQELITIDEKEMLGWAETALGCLQRDECELSVVVVDNAHIHELNKLYLNRDRPTNVISFPQQEGEGWIGASDGVTHLGDIVISAERAQEEAEGTDYSTSERIKQLLIHGICHLTGYNHEDVSADMASEMEAAEKKILDCINNA